MGSFQQICLGTICLVAAYLFGNYVNNNPPLHPEGGNPIAAVSEAHPINGLSNSAKPSAGNIESRLPISEFPPIEKKPAPIVTMKTPLKSRFAVPSVQTSPTNFERSQAHVYDTNNQLPPPSQLAKPNQQPNSALALGSQSFASSPFTEPVAVSPTIQVPDFSAIAAEFKNTPIELPNMSRLGGMPSHPANQAGLVRFGNGQTTSPPNERLKQLVQRFPDNEFRNPNFHPRQNKYSETPQQFQATSRGDFETRIEAVNSNNGFSQADFEPQLNDDIFGLKPQPIREYESLLKNNVAQDQATSNRPVGDHQYDVPPPVPPEPYDSANQVSPGFRGNLTFRPELENRSDDSRNNHFDDRVPNSIAPIDYRTQTQPARLPFRLTEQAKTELVQLQERADSKIGLESTSFVDHTIRDGETLQSISARYFGSPNYYLDIYLANRNKLRNPADTRAGVSIRVPVYESP